jgi:hypothetical protein
VDTKQIHDAFAAVAFRRLVGRTPSLADARRRNAPMNKSEVKGAQVTQRGVGAASRLLHLGSMYLLVAFCLLWVVPANNFDTNRLVCCTLEFLIFLPQKLQLVRLKLKRCFTLSSGAQVRV